VSHGRTVFIAVDPSDSKVAAVTGWHSVDDNSGVEGVWLTTDGGDSWVNVMSNLINATGTVARARPSGKETRARGMNGAIGCD
jgi:hypothetical protein